MQKFMFIIREDLKRLASYTDKQRQDEIPPMLKWVEGIAEGGNYIEGEPLIPNGHYVRKDEVLSDGPFIESKEGISGFVVITAEGLEQATAIAQTCPLVLKGTGAVEVRPFMTVPPELQVDIHLIQKK
jgi:hypothetical protein